MTDLLGCDCTQYVAPQHLSRAQQLACVSAHQRSDKCTVSKDMRIQSMGAAIDAVEENLRESLSLLSSLRADLAAVSRRYSRAGR